MSIPVPLASRLHRAVTSAGVLITGVSIGTPTDRATWTVHPPDLQAAAQPTIDAFNVNDAAHAEAEHDAQVTHALDTERLAGAIVWTLLKQQFPADTDAQTKTKFAVARTRIIEAFRTTPWK